MSITLSHELQSLLDNRLPYLPSQVGVAINSIDWPAKIIAIGHKFGMHVDEMEDFQSVVLKSMIGLIPPENFERELISALALSPANAEKVITEINNEIFEPIHNVILNGVTDIDPLKQSGIHVETINSQSLPNPQLHGEGATTPVASIDFGATVPTVTGESIDSEEPKYMDDYFK